MDPAADDLRPRFEPTRPAPEAEVDGGLSLEPFRLREKLALIAEILVAYLVLLGTLRGKDVKEMVAHARRVRAGQRIEDPREHLVTRRLGKVVGKVLGVLPTDSRCLIRSLVLVRLLARRSISSVLVIGVTKVSEFKAHAWVEHDGLAILPPGEYTRLTEL